MRFRGSESDSLRLFVNLDYLKGAPFHRWIYWVASAPLEDPHRLTTSIWAHPVK